MRFVLSFLLALHLHAAPLPREIAPQAAVLEARPEEAGRKVWHTRFFRIDSDMDLPRGKLLRLALVADTTALAVKSHPLPLFAPPEGLRAKISIYADPAAYEKAGGFRGSAGFYLARRARVLVRGDFLVRPRNAGLLPPHYEEDILVHELVHLCMHRQNAGLPQWLVEGLAEYFACAHAGGGRFVFANMEAALRTHLRDRLNPEAPEIPLLSVSETAAADSRGWLRMVERLPEEERYQAYATALLLAHYHLHGGKQRLESVEELFARPPRQRRELLLIPAESAGEIQKSLERYWQPKGLALRFRTLEEGD